MFPFGNISPDDAARAKALSDATEVPAPAIATNPDLFVKQQKANLNSQIILRDKYLQEYINKDPLASSLSQDDWHNLSKLGESLDNYGQGSIFSKMVEGFERNFGPPGTSYILAATGLRTPKTLEEAQQHPALGAIASSIVATTAGPEYSARVGFGALGAVWAGIKEAVKQETGADIGQYADPFFSFLGDPAALMSVSAMTAPFAPEIAAPLALLAGGRYLANPRLTELGLQMHPALAGGREPLPRSSFVRDVIDAAQAKLDAMNRGEVEKDADATLTKQLHPPTLESYI
jgi:hypothetical protein